MTQPPLPIVRLLPKTKPQVIRHGFPWIFANELVMDRRTKALPAGGFVIVEDAERRPLGLGTINPASKIAVRMLDMDETAVVDEGWLVTRLARALQHRERLYDAPFYRLVHAEADGLPGIVIDRYGDTAVIQPNAAWGERQLDVIVAALVAVTGVTTVIKNGTGRARSLEGLEDEMVTVLGETPVAAIPVPMNGAIYMADVMGGQKTGLFFDQRPNHAFAAKLARGGAVLDVFSHVGGFSLAALASGAASALAVDGSAPALELAASGAAATGVADRFETRQGDAFAVLEDLGTQGAQFDLVVCDPPAFAPAKASLEAGLRAYERVARLAAPLVRDGGYLVVCSCSHAADLKRFRDSSARGIGRGLGAGARRAQLVHTGFAGPDHPLLPQLAESGYLKSLVFHL